MNTKQWYQSKTIIAQIIAMICMWLAYTNIINIDWATQQQVVDLIIMLVTWASQLYAIYGRLTATTQIK